MSRIDINVSRIVHAPRDQVFEVFADVERTPEYFRDVAHVELIGDGPVRVGTFYKESSIIDRQFTMKYEVTVLQPPDQIVVQGTAGGANWTQDARFSRCERGTEVQICLTIRPRTIASKIMFFLLNRKVIHTMRHFIALRTDALAEFVHVDSPEETK